MKKLFALALAVMLVLSMTPAVSAASTTTLTTTVPAATYVQDPVTGQWNITPGATVLTVTGTV